MEVNKIYCGDALEILKSLPGESIHMCITSPPYWGLRDYGTAKWEDGDPECDHRAAKEKSRYDYTMPDSAQCGTHKGMKEGTDQAKWKNTCPCCGARRIDSQLGLEKTPEDYVAKLVEIFREVKRVLRNDGTLWLNLGDCYNGSGKAGNNPDYQLKHTEFGKPSKHKERFGQPSHINSLKPKDLVGIPWRVAFALQADGWWLRSDIIWCLSGGTYIYAKTQKGIMSTMIRDLARLKPETIQLWNGEKWTKVLGILKSKRQGDEIELVLRSGERISCTPKHKFPTNKGLLEAKDIRKGDILKSIILPASDEYTPSVIDEDAVWFAGLYIAEGSRAGDTIQISGHSKESERWKRLQEIAVKFGGHITRTVNGNNMNIRLYGKILNALINELVSGKTSKDKCFAPTVWNYPIRFIASMLEGYLSGDGHWDSENNRWRLGFTRNYNLERDLRTACARLGYKIILNLASVEYGGKSRPAFRGEIRKETSSHWNCKNPNEVMKVRKARCREVYDIGVEDNPHVFALASGILTHNSKPNPMPESVSGSRWERHRIKIKAGYDENNPHPNKIPGGYSRNPNSGGVFKNQAEWTACPGCSKCSPNNGYVLRMSAGRPTRAHEYIFLLTKSAEYFFDSFAVKEVAKVATNMLKYNHENQAVHEMQEKVINKKFLSPQKQKRLFSNLQGMQHPKSFGMEKNRERENTVISYDAEISTNRERKDYKKKMRQVAKEKSLYETISQINKGQNSAEKSKSIDKRQRKTKAIFCDRKRQGGDISETEEPIGKSNSSETECQAQAVFGKNQKYLNGQRMGGNQRVLQLLLHLLQKKCAKINTRSHHSSEQGRRTHEKQCSSSLSIVQFKEKRQNSSRNLRSVWTMSTRPFPESHFAVFPPELPERCIKAGTSEKGVCPNCGKPWVRSIDVYYKQHRKKGDWEKRLQNPEEYNRSPSMSKYGVATKINQTLGWRPSCTCDAGDPIPATVLDCFFGAGTVGVVAKQLGREFIGIELKPEYCKMAERRIAQAKYQFKLGLEVEEEK